MVKDFLEIDEAGADENLFAELVGVGRPAAVLCVDGMDVRAEDVDGVHGIRFAVEDEVGGVKADAEVGQVDVADGARHGGRGLLAGLHEEVLTIARAVPGNLFDRGDGFLVKRVVGIFGDEAAVGLHLLDAEELGEIRGLLERVDAGGAGGARDEADGGGALHEVPHQRLGPTTSTVVR